MDGRIHLLVGDKPAVSVRIEGELTIGRDPGCDFQVSDPKVSRFHCRIEKTGSFYLLRDLNSSNGTFVNGTLITETKLSHGDHIRLGPTVTFLFEVVKEDVTRQREGIGPPGGSTVVIDSTYRMKNLTDFYHEGLSPERFRDILEKLSSLFEIGNIINRYRESSSLLNAILDQIVKVVKAGRYYLLLRDERTSRLEAVATFPNHNESGPLPGISQTILDRVLTHGESILSSDAFHDERFLEAKSIIMCDIQTIMCVPLRSHEKTLGVIYVDSRDPNVLFTREDLKLLSAIGINAGIGIESLRLFEDLKRLFRSTVKSLVAALEANDPYTGGHSVRLAEYSKRLAKCMGLESEEVEKIELAAFLHDIGKIGIPVDVLNNPGSFNTEEVAVMRDHPSIGYDILSKIEGMEEIAKIVRHHHERFDGSGYPDGLAGYDIPLGSRILCLVDVFDALTTDRLYRRRWSFEEAFREISSQSGKQFDPHVVEFMRTCFNEEKNRLGINL